MQFFFSVWQFKELIQISNKSKHACDSENLYLHTFFIYSFPLKPKKCAPMA